MSNVPPGPSGLVPDAGSFAGTILEIFILCGAAVTHLAAFGPRAALSGLLRLQVSHLSPQYILARFRFHRVARAKPPRLRTMPGRVECSPSRNRSLVLLRRVVDPHQFHTEEVAQNDHWRRLGPRRRGQCRKS